MRDAGIFTRQAVLAATTVTALWVGTAMAWADTAATVGTTRGTAAAAESRLKSDLKADEQEMLAAARREADERKRAGRVLDGTVGAPASEAAQRTIVNIGEPAPAEKIALEKARQDELQRLSDKLRRASALRPTKPVVPVETPWATEVTTAPSEPTKPGYHAEQRSALGQPSSASVAASATDGRVTVLMVMSPGDRGIRRFEKTADPILCSNDGCYISNGAGIPAQFVSLRRTFGIANTFGPRAGACRQQTGCVFRGVDVSAANAILQPVDLKVMVHDRRAMQAAAVDTTCRVDAGQLTCGRPIRGTDYTLWVVPEHIAQKAGSAALQAAIVGGLADAAVKASLR
jgi:hypothetical protein